MLRGTWESKLARVPSETGLEMALSKAGVKCVASGTVGSMSKAYFYAQVRGGFLCWSFPP